MSEEVMQLAKSDENVVLLSSGTFDLCREFARFYPSRYFEFGDLSCLEMIAEGFVTAGKKPIVVVKEGDFMIKF